MKTIYKYELKKVKENKISMPNGSEILSIQNQGGVLYIWAFVDTDNKLCERIFEIYGTGQNMHYYTNFNRKYMATVQDGAYVWHIYELIAA